jgi:hypothetical protein
MDLDFAFLADAAEAPAGHKLYVLGGGFTDVNPPAYPFALPQFALVIKLHLRLSECERPHRLEVEFWDEDGHRLREPIVGEFVAQRNELQPARGAYVQLVLNVVGFPLEKSGIYEFPITVDGHQLKSLQLYANPLPAPEPPE